jgi:hypothetical protein
MPLAEVAADRRIARGKGVDHWLDMTTIAIIRIKRPLSLRERGLNQVITFI